MSTTGTQFSPVIAHHDQVEWAPFEHPEAGGTGRTVSFGEAAIIRAGSTSGHPLVVAYWRSQPATSPLYDVPLGDESGFVVEGRASVELVESGEVIEMRAGQSYTLGKGTLTRWTIHEPFVKFVVVNDAPALESA
jgi:uncharacterized cupin superfamily protein